MRAYMCGIDSGFSDAACASAFAASIRSFALPSALKVHALKTSVKSRLRAQVQLSYAPVVKRAAPAWSTSMRPGWSPRTAIRS